MDHHPTSLYSNPFICATNELGQGLIKRIHRPYLAPVYNTSKVTMVIKGLLENETRGLSDVSKLPETANFLPL